MSTKIFYFSGTGNSLKVSKDIAKELGDTELVSIPAVSENEQLDLSADAIGLVFPVYAWGVPRIVNKFISKIRTDKYVFLVLTCGGSPGYTMIKVKKQLAANGTKLSSAFEIHMPDNYIPMFDVTADDKKREMFNMEEVKAKEIADIVRLRNVNQPVIKKNIKNTMLSGPIYKISISNFYHLDKNFWTNEKCNGCEICSKICPVENIDMKDGKPVWKHDCEACMACIHWCPARAVQYGKKTEKRGRYTHPDIKLKEMLNR